jgi:hypothetical protein
VFSLRNVVGWGWVTVVGAMLSFSNEASTRCSIQIVCVVGFQSNSWFCIDDMAPCRYNKRHPATWSMVWLLTSEETP